MKKSLPVIALLWALCSSAQSSHGHEVKAGVPVALDWPSAEVSYEYLFRDIFTVGAAFALSLNQSAKPDQVLFLSLLPGCT